MKKQLLVLFLVCLHATNMLGQDSATINKIYRFEIKREIDAPAWNITKKAIAEGKKANTDLFLLEMDTYGGRVDYADSIRSLFLDLETPIYVLIKNNAASAGALISISCDSIYMNTGSTIGAATVVDQTGTPASEKAQSFFRGKMRATAIAKNRDPNIAQGMVDPDIVVEDIVDSTKLITLTVDEAILHGFCDGNYETVEDLLKFKKLDKVKQLKYEPSSLDQFILILIDPTVSGILMMIMMGGLFLELKTPGIGFAGFLSLSAALLYFAPHYIHGLADNIEILAVVAGVILILLEVFVIPGTGLAGIAGALLFVFGLSFSLIDRIPQFDNEYEIPGIEILWAFGKTLGSSSLGILIAVFIASKILNNQNQVGRKFVLNATMADDKIAPSNDTEFSSLIGKVGTAWTDLSPGGKVSIDDELYDAISSSSFIEKGTAIKVTSSSNSQLKVRETV